MAVPFLSWGTTPHRSDTVNTLLKRIAGSTSGGGGGGDSHQSGSGSPIGVVTPNGINAIYRDTSADTYWWATGATNADWHQFV